MQTKTKNTKNVNAANSITKLVNSAKVENVANTSATLQTAKVRKQKIASNEQIAVNLLKSKAKEEEIISTFTKIYKHKKNITNKAFIIARAKIYMEIAAKKLAAA